MNRSYSKIRHIQESNLILEQRRFKQLMESKLGDVRPLIYENPTPPPKKPSPTPPPKDGGGTMKPVPRKTPNSPIKKPTGSNAGPGPGPIKNTETLHAKVFSDESRNTLIANIDIENPKLDNINVYFDYSLPSKENENRSFRQGYFVCNTKEIVLKLNTDTTEKTYYISDIFQPKLQQYCDLYSQNNSDVNNNMAWFYFLIYFLLW